VQEVASSNLAGPTRSLRAILPLVTNDAKKALSEALHLSSEDRAEVADGLLASLDPPGPGSDRTNEVWIAEIERHAREARSGSPGTPWPEVRRQIEDRPARE